MTLSRVAATTGLTIFLVLAGTSAGNAYWSDQVQATASVSAARSSGPGPGRTHTDTVGSVDVSLRLTSALPNGGWETTSNPVSIVQRTTDWSAPSQPG